MYWGTLEKTAIDPSTIDQAIATALADYQYFKTFAVWGLLPKSAIDDSTIEETIDTSITDHNDDPTAHLEAGQSLQSHKASVIIDHVAESIVNDKLITYTRAYTVIVKIPDTTNENIFFPAVDYEEYPFDIISPTKTMAEILGRSDSGDDSEYIATNCTEEGYTYFQMTAPTLDLGQKLYKITIKMRCKLLNATIASNNFDLACYDGNTYTFNATPVWQDFEQIFYRLVDPDENLHTIDQWVLDIQYFGINYSPSEGSAGENELGISQFYINADVVSETDQENYFDLKEAVDYCNSLGGGSIFVKDGTYTFPSVVCELNGNIHIYGESSENTIVNFDDPDYYLKLGNVDNSYYDTGSCTFTNNSATVTGSDTVWTTANTVGRYILDMSSGRYFKIIARVSNTEITINKKYQGQTRSGRFYVICSMLLQNSIENLTTNSYLDIRNTIDCSVKNVILNEPYIAWEYSENMSLENNIFNNGAGLSNVIFVFNSSIINCTFEGFLNTIFNFYSNSVYNLIFNNLFSNNLYQCILLHSLNTSIINNVIVNNGLTIGGSLSPIFLCSGSMQNIISGNQITYCASYGIGSEPGTDYNVITNNVVLNNTEVGIPPMGAHSIIANNVI